MKKMIKILALVTGNCLISEIEEVGAEIGEPDCKLINPFLISDVSGPILEPFLLGITVDDEFMISSDKIVTLATPTPHLVEKYESLTSEK